MKTEDPYYHTDDADILEQDDAFIDEEEQEAGEEEKPEEDEKGLSLKEYIKEESVEDERPQPTRLSLRKILGGDILYTKAIRKQIWLMMLIIGFFVLYISNRYSCQKDQVEIALLNKQLKNAQYKALAISSELTEHCRESHVLEMLKENNDSSLHPADQPPYIIIVNRNE